MAAPSQHIVKYDELYDRLCDKMLEATRLHAAERDANLRVGLSSDEMHEFEVEFRRKWVFMDKMIAGKASHCISKATLAIVREILGDELDQYL